MGKRANGEGSKPKRRKDGRWECRYTAHTTQGPKRRSVYGNTRAEAHAKLVKALADRGGTIAELFEPENLSVGAYLTRWLEDSVKGSVAELTYRRYAQDIRLHIAPVLGGVKLTKLTPAHVQALYSAKLSEGLASSTVRGLHKALRKALGQAEKWGMVEQNAAAERCSSRQSPAPHTKGVHRPLRRRCESLPRGGEW